MALLLCVTSVTITLDLHTCIYLVYHHNNNAIIMYQTRKQYNLVNDNTIVRICILVCTVIILINSETIIYNTYLCDVCWSRDERMIIVNLVTNFLWQLNQQPLIYSFF